MNSPEILMVGLFLGSYVYAWAWDRNLSGEALLEVGSTLALYAGTIAPVFLAWLGDTDQTLAILSLLTVFMSAVALALAALITRLGWPTPMRRLAHS